MARTLSNTLTVAGAGLRAGAAAVAAAGFATVAGAPTRVDGAAVAGRGAGGAVIGAGAAAGAAVAAGAGAAEPADEAGGRLGSLIVGEAVGLGGKEIRTVSFFG